MKISTGNQLSRKGMLIPYLALLCLLFHETGMALATYDAPPPSRQQIEADWLRQETVRQLPAAKTAAKVTCEQDACGGVDGIKDGKWGFHTENEPNPWWQVDLAGTIPINQVVVWNRCDAGMAPRNSRLIVQVSVDGKQFQQVYQHDGTVFYGFTDQKPLVIPLNGVAGRYLRLSLAGRSYFHLDEVEVYAAGSTTNVAFGKAATQSSVSMWSARHAGPSVDGQASLNVSTVLERGLKLAECLERQGVVVASARNRLREIQASLLSMTNALDADARREWYMQAHWAVRQMALTNPLLDFDSILFVKRAPGMFPHMSDQFYGWWSRGGGGIYLLENFKSGAPRVRCLTSSFAEGSFIGPDISFDGKKVLFSYCKYYPQVADMAKVDKEKLPEDCFYHVYEMNLDGSGLRQVTHGRYDDFDARYLPNDDLLFVSTRKGLALQCTGAFSDATRLADLPDSYVRCGGDSIRPVPVFTMHAMNRNGENIRPLSAFENFEWTPSVAADGRILYTRWDYIDRFNGHFFSLWSANQDGTNPQLVYGNYTVKPQVKFEARSIPGSSRLVMTAGAHHSISGGSICLLDRNKGTEFDAPLTCLTPEVVYPETGGWPEHYYANPWPLSEEFFLVAWSDQKLPPHCRATELQNPRNAMGIYLLDAFGNQELLYRDPEITSMHPIPVAPRVKPPAQSSLAGRSQESDSAFLVQDVYQGLDGVPRGTIKQLRVVAVPPKVQPFMNRPILGVSAEDPGKYVMGTVPVEQDGSAYFKIPPGVPVFFQALNEQGLAVQTMRTLTYVMPSQVLSCVGCHEHRDTAPSSTLKVMAASHSPSLIKQGPPGSWPLRFDQLIQPVLDQHCLVCHQPGSTHPQAARLNLMASNAYPALLGFDNHDLKNKAFERDRSFVNQGTAANSKLWQILTRDPVHRNIGLDAGSLGRFATWMDTYAHRVGHYSDQQEKELEQFRASLARLLESPKE